MQKCKNRQKKAADLDTTQPNQKQHTTIDKWLK